MTMLRWTAPKELGHDSVLGQHALAGSELFGRDQLTALLEPGRDGPVRVHTAGSNLAEWRDCDRGRLDGAQLLTAIETDCLWVNVVDVGRDSSALAALLDDVATELREYLPVTRVRANLLISSPHATVHYHVDPEPNLLVQLAGTKTVWLYPPRNVRFCSPANLAAVCSGTVDEEIPYQRAFDVDADAFELCPGDVLSWPQNAPHRVRNGDAVNVSLSISWYTREVDRRIAVYAAADALDRRPPIDWLREDGAVATARILAFKARRRLMSRRRDAVGASSIAPVVLMPGVRTDSESIRLPTESTRS
jgi:hypothetical protein